MLLAGRKRESPVWDYFEYNEVVGKSQCLVKDDKTGKTCCAVLAGKYSSNLVAHLARFHKDEHAIYKEKCLEVKATKERVEAQGNGRLSVQLGTNEAPVSTRLPSSPYFKVADRFLRVPDAHGGSYGNANFDRLPCGYS